MEFFQALAKLIGDFGKWLGILASPILIFVLVKNGLKIMQAEDPHDMKAAIEGIKRTGVGVGIALMASVLAGLIVKYFA
ncbi:pilin [Priestia aryabhattai]|uniref:pilin n=1 Tax=Priestia aryabhattai TaxID=412384 RepID=UPI00203D696C|nr:pilin [Priestia aryabhattai]MCM3774233.1 pilin [Priestia aryabhattai]